MLLLDIGKGSEKMVSNAHDVEDHAKMPTAQNKFDNVALDPCHSTCIVCMFAGSSDSKKHSHGAKCHTGDSGHLKRHLDEAASVDNCQKYVEEYHLDGILQTGSCNSSKENIHMIHTPHMCKAANLVCHNAHRASKGFPKNLLPSKMPQQAQNLDLTKMSKLTHAMSGEMPMLHYEQHCCSLQSKFLVQDLFHLMQLKVIKKLHAWIDFITVVVMARVKSKVSKSPSSSVKYISVLPRQSAVILVALTMLVMFPYVARCDVDINECESDPCLHNGTCNDLIDDFSCNCTTNFTGKRCEINVSTCIS